MTRKATLRVALLSVIAAVLVGMGCNRDLTTLGPAAFPASAGVFVGGFVSGVDYQAFANSKLDAIHVDPSAGRDNGPALRFSVPAASDPTGGFAGGALVAAVPRDLSGYDALTFWARSSITASLDMIGFGNDNTGTSRFAAQATGIVLSSTWRKYIIPIPLAAKLVQERGLFQFADGADNGVAYDIWFQDIQFERVGTIAFPRPTIGTRTTNEEVGRTVTIQGPAVVFDVGGSDLTVTAAPGYFTFTSSDTTIAKASGDGAFSILASGTATITAKLGAETAAGAVTINSTAPPTVAAPTPTRAAIDVISLFSDAYTNVPVGSWSTDWDMADVSDATIGGNAVKRYANFTYAGIDFSAQTINVTAMTNLHLDVWMRVATAFSVKLVDFGPNNVYGGGDDAEFTVAFSPTSSPALAAGAWTSLDIPLTRFTGLTSRAHLAQIIIQGASPITYVDNVYFYLLRPLTAAPAPTVPASDVIALFSNAYTNVPVDSWSAAWDAADLTDMQIDGNDTKRYTNLGYAGIEFTTHTINASGMTHFHMDIWTPFSTAAPAAFKIKLVDFGADGVFGGGDDVEHELTLTATTSPALATGSWVSLDIPLSRFTGLTTRSHLAQLIISGDPKAVYVDNVYFYVASPSTPAPTPTASASDVISLFSNAYTNVAVDTWSATWDNADVADVQIVGNATKRYTSLTLAGIEFTSHPIDATAMTRFHMDIWTPDATTAPATFKVKLVDFGANGVFGGGDDVEHELTFSASSSPALATGSWVSLDIPLSAFTGLVTRGHLAQIVLSSTPKVVYVDNVYFYVTSPTVAAPTPTVAAADVIALFSNAYTNVTVDTWSASWDQANVADVQVAGNDTKKYTNLTFAGIEFASAPINATAMTRFHMDVWTPNATAAPAAVKVKLVDFGADGVFGGGDDVEQELTFTAASTPALATGSWVSLDIPLSAFTGLTTRGHLAQMIISSDPKILYVDNVYFYRTAVPGPTTAAPTPSVAAANVISLFSNAYTNVMVDTWSASWDSADETDLQVAGNDTKKYTNLVFAGIEFTSAPINATAMTTFHVDIWTPDASAAPASFSIKLVDFGADGAYGGGDDVESQLTYTAATTPALATGGWVSLDIPLTSFTTLTTKAHLAQMLFVADATGPKTVYVDNVYFYSSGGGGGGGSGPTTVAPTPIVAAANVLALFSSAYTNAPVDTWLTSWSGAQSALVDPYTIPGTAHTVKKYALANYAGIEFVGTPVGTKELDASTMTHFHIDVWSPEATHLIVKIHDAGADLTVGTGDDSEGLFAMHAGTTPALTGTGQWVSLDIPLSAFTVSVGSTWNKTHLAQIVLVEDGPAAGGTVYVDNMYFYNSGGGGGGTAPTVAAPTPSVAAANVISLFSNAYTNVTVDTWSASWDSADETDLQVAGNDTKKYTNLVYAGIEFTSAPINATAMTTFHVDIWTPDASAAPASFSIKLVDFGADGAYGGGDDVESQLTYTAATTPALATGSWVSLDIPLSAFTALTTRGHLAQMLFVADATGPKTVFVDNVYFYNNGGGGGGGGGSGPTTVAPTPTVAAANVIALFSSAYTSVPVDTWLTSWSGAQSALVDPYTIPSTAHTVKKYALANYAGIEFIGTPAGTREINASSMTHFHIDVWSPEATHLIVKIHDAGADLTVGTGDDSEGLFAIASGTTPALTGTGQWVSLDIPLSAFTVSVGSTWNKTHLAQIVLVEDGPAAGGTVYVDNMYFYNSGGGGGGTAPTVAAPTPSVAAANVISLFSNAYTNVTVDTWSASWDSADETDLQVAGNDTKKYTNLVYAGIEFTSAPINATAMTTFHVDIWTPDASAAPASFSVKLVDFGANGAYGGGDDVEAQLTYTAATTPALATGSWVSLEIPLSAFTALTTRGHLAQLLFVADATGPKTVFVDNVYLHN